MKLEDFNFKDKEFKYYFLNYFCNPFSLSVKEQRLFGKIQSDNFTNNDLVEFYLILDKFDYDYYVLKALFDYKMKKISDYRLAKFVKIVKSITGLIINERMSYSRLLGDSVTYSEFYKLVDIFLDEI